MEINKIYCIDNVKGMKQLPDNYVDLTVTSPPYSDLRDYKKHHWDFEGLAKELYRVTKDGGVLVWVVGDKTSKGTEELTPFRQAIYFQDFVGFNTWDTMIYNRQCPFPANVRYNQDFEFMFIFSKGKPNTFNPLKQMKSEKEVEKILKGNKNGVISKSYRNKDGSITRASSDERIINRLEKTKNNLKKTRSNIWYIPAGYRQATKDIIAYKHPATFPEQLANDHILSWSNIGDLILDPFMGSGTTAKMAKQLGRNFIGFEISQEYVDIANTRIQSVSPQ